MSGGYAVASTARQRIRVAPTIRSSQFQVEKRKHMKLSLKQRFRNWLMDDNSELYSDLNQPIETDRLSSDGMRFQLYKASGGFVIEIRSYDRRKDENVNSMYVITESQDLGEELGKIITMESLR